MAAATMANNALALVFTVLFARLLGADGLRLAGRAGLDVRDPGGARLGGAGRGGARDRARPARRGPAAGGDAVGLAKTAAGRGVVVTACAVLLREPIARSDLRARRSGRRPPAFPTGVLWLLLSVERGALQGAHLYKPVAWSIVLEAGGRLCFGLALVAAGDGRDGRLPRHAAVAGRDGVRALVDLARAGSARPRRAPRRGGCAISSAARGRRSSACSWSRCCRTST